MNSLLDTTGISDIYNLVMYEDKWLVLTYLKCLSLKNKVVLCWSFECYFWFKLINNPLTNRLRVIYQLYSKRRASWNYFILTGRLRKVAFKVYINQTFPLCLTIPLFLFLFPHFKMHFCYVTKCAELIINLQRFIYISCYFAQWFIFRKMEWLIVWMISYFS